jgi:hypothetical protein
MGIIVAVVVEVKSAFFVKHLAGEAWGVHEARMRVRHGGAHQRVAGAGGAGGRESEPVVGGDAELITAALSSCQMVVVGVPQLP